MGEALLPAATQLGVEGGYAGGVLAAVGDELLLSREEAQPVDESLEMLR